MASLIAAWGERTGAASAGRHVLAIQDTSELSFATRAGRRRGLGAIGKGVGRGVLLHAMLALDARSGACLGLVSGRIWTRRGRVRQPAKARRLADKESQRWLSVAAAAKTVLAPASRVTVIADRESDIYAEWALLPAPGFDLLTRAMQDRRLSPEGTLFAASRGWPVAGRRRVKLRERADRPAREAVLELRFGPVALARPDAPGAPGLPERVALRLVEAVEIGAPRGTPALHWRLLTTHAVDTAGQAWQIVDWYRRRWAIEQLFRTLKTQGLKIEDSQLDRADSLMKLVALATHAAAIVLQLVQARDGRSREPAAAAFAPDARAVLARLAPALQGKTAPARNPHPPDSLAWAAWIVGRLGGWDGYPSSRPPGPITLKHGLDRLHAFLQGLHLMDVCIP